MCFFLKVYPDETDIFPLFRLSYHWITPVGVTTVLVVGIIVSLLTGKTDTRFMDPELISPVCQWMLPPESVRYEGSALRKARHLDQRDGDKVLMTIERTTSTLDLKVRHSTKPTLLITLTPLFFRNRESVCERTHITNIIIIMIPLFFVVS